MKPANSTDFAIAIAFLAFSLIALTLWIPLDIESGIIEKVRRREKMGDALFPTALAVAMALVAGLSAVVAFLGEERRPENHPGLGFLAKFLGIMVTSLLLMRYSGPVAVELANLFGADLAYRNLRDTVPWKYLGFAIGGVFLTGGLIALVQGRLSLRGILIGAGAVLVLILLYDLPFDDLLLPPNGDV
jgi:hypothetical protein